MPNNFKDASPFASKIRKTTKARVPPEWMDELELVRRIIWRTRKINTPQTVHLSRRDPRGLPDLKIAAISTDLAAKDLSRRDMQEYRLWVVEDPNARKRLRKDFLHDLEVAAQAGAKLVCFNELAYPTPLVASEDSGFQAQLR